MTPQAWQRPASYFSHEIYRDIKKEHKRGFSLRHKLRNQKIDDGDGLLMDLWNDDVGLSDALRSSVEYFVFFLSFI
jgi:hypothetical protein